MDGYRWFQYGSKFIPRRNPVLKKLYFTSVLASGHDHRFKRLVFFLLSETSKAVVIHYVGDESIAVDFPHGNSKEDNSHVFKRTCPSVLTTLSTNTKNSPSSLYKSAISNPPTECPPTLQSMYMPRNLRQIKNIQYKERQKCRLTHDAIYNLHEIAYDLDGFVKVINHTINAVKAWLKKHGASSVEIPVYISHLRDLLNQRSASSYENKLAEFQTPLE